MSIKEINKFGIKGLFAKTIYIYKANVYVDMRGALNENSMSLSVLFLHIVRLVKGRKTVLAGEIYWGGFTSRGRRVGGGWCLSRWWPMLLALSRGESTAWHQFSGITNTVLLPVNGECVSVKSGSATLTSGLCQFPLENLATLVNLPRVLFPHGEIGPTKFMGTASHCFSLLERRKLRHDGPRTIPVLLSADTVDPFKRKWSIG